MFTEDKTLFYPTGVHEEIEKGIEIIDDGYLSFCFVNEYYYRLIRIKLQLRRRKLIYTLKSKFVDVRDIFDECFQTTTINKYFRALGLDRKILSAYNFRKHIDTKHFRTNKRHSIISCAILIRNKRSPYSTETFPNATVSRNAFNDYVKQLTADGIYIVTTSKIDLIPIKLL